MARREPVRMAGAAAPAASHLTDGPARPLISPRLLGLKEKTRLKEVRMARLIYSAIMSLDGYIADADGRFEWAAPGDSLPELLSIVTLHPVEIREIKESDWAQVWPIVREIVVAAETFAYDPSMSSSQAQDI